MTLAESKLTTHYLSVLIVPAIVTHCAPPPVQTNLNSALRLGVAPNQPQSTSGTRSILNYSRQTKEIHINMEILCQQNTCMYKYTETNPDVSEF